jgi:hypothetical protein
MSIDNPLWGIFHKTTGSWAGISSFLRFTCSEAEAKSRAMKFNRLAGADEWEARPIPTVADELKNVRNRSEAKGE